MIRSEYGAFWKCIQAAGIYVFTQLCKMLVLATFFPDTSTSSTGDLNLFSVSNRRIYFTLWRRTSFEIAISFD